MNPIQINTAKHRKPWRFRVWQANPQPFRRVVLDWRFLSVLFPLLIFTNWVGHRWLFERGSLAGTDVLMRAPQPKRAQYCRLITVDSDEFSEYLGDPFDPEKLAAVLDIISEYQPKVIVVDIDTSPKRFQRTPVPRDKSKIVWARVSYEALKNGPSDATRTYDWHVGTVLGNRIPQPEYIGSPLFPQDPDGTVRSFQRVVQVDANAPALYWEALRAYCDNGGTNGKCSAAESRKLSDAELKPRVFRADWDFDNNPLSDLMNTKGSLKPQPGQLGEIVVVGASFSDIHPTPFGPKLGIELTASAMETELSESESSGNGWLRRATLWIGSWASQWLPKILLAIAIAWLNTRLLPLWAAGGTLLLLAVVFVASFVGIYYGIFRMDFLPFMIGIWIEQLVEGAERAHHHMAH